jgi:membrane protein YqaA with SNARE-associated domain
LKNIIAFSKSLPKHANRKWIPYALAAIAFADYFIFVIPLDAIVVGCFMAVPRRWLAFSFWSSLGSVIGAAIFSELIRIFGISTLLNWYPDLMKGAFVEDFSNWLQNYGFWPLIGAAISPLAQHPFVAIETIAGVSLITIVASLFIGRMLKYAIYTWLSKHARKRLARFFED